MSDKLIRVLVVDDHALVRNSLSKMLSREPDLEVIGTAVNGRQAVEIAVQEEPDVIIMDISMPELDGIRATGEIQSLGISTQVIMLSMHHSTALLHQAKKSGAAGYVVKQQSSRELIPAIRAAYAGQTSF